METQSDAKPLKTNMASQRRVVGVVVFCILVLGGAILGLFVFGNSFYYTVGPEEIVEIVEIEKKKGTSLGFGDQFIVYSISAEYEFSSPGYRSELVKFTTESSQRRHHVELKPLPGYLTILVTDEFPTTVQINGEPQSNLNDVPLEQGNYNIAVVREGHEITSQGIAIEGYGAEQQISFDLSRYQAFLSLQTMPPTATIELNSEPVGMGRYDGGVAAGSHDLSVYSKGYESRNFDLTLESGETYDLGTITLKPKLISVNVQTTPSNASILLNGDFIGESDATFTVVPLRTYELIVNKPGYRTHREMLSPRIGVSITRKINFEQETVNVNVTINPAGEVFVNGISRGRSPQSLDLYPGDRIEAKQTGLATQSAIVDLKQGASQSMVFTLSEPSVHAYKTAEPVTRVAGTLELVRFPPLKFVKRTGSSQAESMTIELTRPFYLGATEVTVEAYQKFKTNVTGSDVKQPITNITWNEAAQFCNWLSRQEGLSPFYLFDSNNFVKSTDRASLGFRLPSEAEWEAGAGYDWANAKVSEPFEWGSEPNVPLAFANLAGQELASQRATNLDNFKDNHKQMAPVKSYRPNFNGLYDMTGNAAEWVHDHFKTIRAVAGGPDYLGPRTGFAHVVKGGSYLTTELANTEINSRDFSASRESEIGFRIARWIY